MHTFALIFRPTRSLDPATLPQRNAAARAWVMARHAEGIMRGASPLEDGGAVVGQDAVAPLADARAVAAVLVVEAADLDAAVALARTHPNLAYGAEIEVRPVRAVALPPR